MFVGSKQAVGCKKGEGKGISEGGCFSPEGCGPCTDPDQKKRKNHEWNTFWPGQEGFITFTGKIQAKKFYESKFRDGTADVAFQHTIDLSNRVKNECHDFADKIGECQPIKDTCEFRDGAWQGKDISDAQSSNPPVLPAPRRSEGNESVSTKMPLLA